MKKIILIIALLVFGTTCTSQELTLNKQNLLKLLPFGLHYPWPNSYVIDRTGIYISYLGRINENDPFSGPALFLAKLNNEGNFDFNRLEVLSPFELSEGFIKCFSNGAHLMILAGLQVGGKAFIGIYDIEQKSLDKIILEDIGFSDVIATFDEYGNFHITKGLGIRYLRLKRQNDSYIADLNIDLSEKGFEGTNVDNVINRSLPKAMTCWQNKLITMYHMEIYDPITDQWSITYDKIGIQILNLSTFEYEPFKTFDITDVASEQISDVEYPKIKVYQPDLSQKPIIFFGGKQNNRNHLYRIELDDILQPVTALQKKSIQYTSAIRNKELPKDIFWDFVKIYKPNVDPYKRTELADFFVLGIEKKPGSSFNYYYKEIR